VAHVTSLRAALPHVRACLAGLSRAPLSDFWARASTTPPHLGLCFPLCLVGPRRQLDLLQPRNRTHRPPPCMPGTPLARFRATPSELLRGVIKAAAAIVVLPSQLHCDRTSAARQCHHCPRKGGKDSAVGRGGYRLADDCAWSVGPKSLSTVWKVSATVLLKIGHRRRLGSSPSNPHHRRPRVSGAWDLCAEIPGINYLHVFVFVSGRPSDR
jgi:hypothetical protein